VSSSGQQLKLLSYNIQAGTSTGRYREYVTRSWRQILPNSQRVENMDAIAELVRDYDIVALQEVDCGSLRSGFVNQAKYLATHARFPWWRYQGNRKIGIVAHPGNGLLSRIKPSDIEEHRLPGAIPGRGAMVVRYGEGRQAFYLVVLHLALGRRARAQQLEYVADLIKTRPNTVVMGDFNAGPAAHEVLRFCRQADLIQPGESALTFPSWQPQRAIDQILVSPGIRVREIRALPVTFSDHQPLAMTIEFGSGVDLPAQQKSESFREFTEYSQ